MASKVGLFTWSWRLVCLVLLANACSGKTVNSELPPQSTLDAGLGPSDAGRSTFDASIGLGTTATSASSLSSDPSTSPIGSSATSETETPTTGQPTTTAATTSTSTTTNSTTTTDTTEVSPDRFWVCGPSLYGNGKCDCGCGILDIDCESQTDVAQCETCDNGCSNFGCPSRIDPQDTTQCARVSPEAWTCDDRWYQDGETCHCGCGALDPDCGDSDIGSCEVCNTDGSCAASLCPSSIDANDITACAVPEGWTCFAGYYGDGVCHCGCGVQDGDCGGLASFNCDSCIGCNDEGCPGTIDADDNRICTGVPYRWTCADRYYNDGQLCNCGCGALDPDCESSDLAACDVCDFEGSCSTQACPGRIYAYDNAYCQQPPPPPEWSCDAYRYGDGYYCDCGCGILDLDCANAEFAECDRCCDSGYGYGSYCPGRVDVEDTTQCLPVPEAWTCADVYYGDGFYCDCGCGEPDPDCPAATSDVCSRCSAFDGSCSRDSTCETIVSDDNTTCTDLAPPEWTCDSNYYHDGDACDCGCGITDVDCNGDTSLDACDICNAEGSCSDNGCTNNPSIDPSNNAICVQGETSGLP